MRTKISFVLAVLGVCGCLMLPPWPLPRMRAQSKVPSASGAKATEGLAISLRELASVVDSVSARRLYGATGLLGFVLAEDQGGHDCILVTTKERDRPVLQLEDLAVAYHNVCQGPNRPACTIDPRAEILAKMAALARTIMSSGNEVTIERNLKEWKKWAGSMQDVKVFHVDPGTHFAKIMVDTDYDLKSICNGAIAVKGITSLSDLLLKEVKEEIATTGNSAASLQIYNRFWFNPGRTSYETDGTKVFLLTSCSVALLTEQEALTENGARTRTAKANPLAKRFADQLTTKFADLTKAKPAYRELENLYRAVAVADLLHREAKKVGMSDVLTNSLGRVAVTVQKPTTQLAGKYAVKKAHGEIAGGTYMLWLPSCGGVSINIDMAKAQRKRDTTGRLIKLSNAILSTRPATSSVAWRFPL